MTHESRDLAIIEGEITIITERLDALTAAHAKYQAAHAKAYQEADPVTLLKAEAQMNAHMAAIRSLQEQQTTLEPGGSTNPGPSAVSREPSGGTGAAPGPI